MGEEERTFWRSSVTMWRRNSFMFAGVIMVESFCLIALAVAHL